MSGMVSCAACGKLISTQERADGIRERDQAYHVSCAPDDLLDDAASEWKAILDRGLTYFVKKYSVQGRAKPGGRQANVGLFAELGKALAEESRRRKK